MKTKTRVIAAAAVCLLSAQGDAAMTYNIQNGKLMSVGGVEVNGVTYDLAFADGTCVAVFNGCASSAAFQFSNGSDASAASTVISDSVLVDGVVVNGTTYNFASDPQTVNGFGNRGGDVLTPFAVNGSKVTITAARGTYQFVYNYSATTDSTNDEYSVWAKFTPAGASLPAATGAVPEPATWAMMLFGFGGLGYSMRRRPKASARIRFV